MIGVIHASYAVVWDEGDGRRHTGRLDIRDEGLHLEGRSRGDLWRSRHVLFSDIAGVVIGRSEADRIDGGRTLVVELNGRPPVRILVLGGSDVLHELTDLVAGPLGHATRPDGPQP
jgi:hypothetical protein